jgi:phenylpyruvate tautomerase
MPFIRVETNVSQDQEEKQQFIKRFSGAVAGMLGKPENYVMVALDAEKPLVFGGTGEPAAYVSLGSIGLSSASCPDLSAGICKLLESELSIPPNRIYIDFRDLDGKMFGYDGKTF